MFQLVLKNVFNLIFIAFVLCPAWAFSYTTEKDGRTYIVDQNSEEWDITQAMTLGFKPRHFQYGIGKNAFQTLDDSSLTDNHFFASKTERVIGIEDSTGGKAFSVDKLRRHEIANTWQDKDPVTVGY